MHRLPPNHQCALLQDFLERPARDREFIERVQGRAGSPQERVASSVRNALILRFSKTELAHLVLGTALVTAVGLSINHYQLRWDFLAIFISAFMVHELGHKFLAQIYRAWAEFRVIFYGAAMTAISIFLPFKFIAPGAVFVSGSLSEARHGRVSWIGPLTNLAMGSGFIIAYLIAESATFDFPSQILAVGARFNGWIALFNLIPFMGLDGSKIFAWNKAIWILSFLGAIGLFIGSDLISGGGILRFLAGLF
jgi:Zn-dependent protease